ncbi:molybdopterin molybdotransferase MoeA [Actinacidiphila rubida]
MSLNEMSPNDERRATVQDPRNPGATPPAARGTGVSGATPARPRPGTTPTTSAPSTTSPGPPPARREARDPHAHPATPWPDARRLARQAGRRLAPQAVPLGEQALGRSLARGLVALTDLPSFDSSAMDGWAVAGPGPWLVKGQVLAGQRHRGALHGGHALRVATGTALPPGTTAVLRSEHGRTEERTDGTWLQPRAPHLAPGPGQEIRHRGQECRGGDELLPTGTLVTPTVLGLAAAAGYDDLVVTARPRVELLVLGDELLDHGLPRSGRVRDALGPMLPSWLRALGADVTDVRRLVDDAGALHDAVTTSGADLVVTTGGTASGPVDHVHPVLAAIGARLLVDGVAVRPGHPMLLAALPSGTSGADGRKDRHLIGLPGNPLAAVSGVLTLVAPLLRTLGGRPVPAPYAAPLTEDVHGHPQDTRLVPVVFDDESAARPLHFAGPAMLRGLAAADGMAVIPPGGARAGDETAVLDTGALGPSWGSGG